MKKRFFTLIFPVIALVLEILPYGAVLNFLNQDGQITRRLYSYFSLTPYGYANFAPLITAILTCVLLVMCIVYTLTNKKGFLTSAQIISVISFVASLCPLLYGISGFSILGAFISLTLALQAALILYLRKLFN